MPSLKYCFCCRPSRRPSLPYCLCCLLSPEGLLSPLARLALGGVSCLSVGSTCPCHWATSSSWVGRHLSAPFAQHLAQAEFNKCLLICSLPAEVECAAALQASKRTQVQVPLTCSFDSRRLSKKVKKCYFFLL